MIIINEIYINNIYIIILQAVHNYPLYIVIYRLIKFNKKRFNLRKFAFHIILS